jgi:Ca2+-transporting ATPase
MSGRRDNEPVPGPSAGHADGVMAGAEPGKSLVTATAPGAPPPGEDEACWHALDAQAALARLGSGPAGLADREHARRLAFYGPNLPEGRRKREPWWEELGESLAEPLQLLLIVVAVLSAVFGEVRDAIAIAAVIAAVAVTETVTEVRAAAAIEALRAMTAPTARLHREGWTAEVPAASLVPGDVVAVEAGDIVPADARVLAARGLRVDESTLTGEAGPAGKSEEPVPAATGLAGRSSLLHAGTAVVAGEGRAVVVATGPATELGLLGRLAAETREPATPLQAAMSQLARAVLVAAVAASVLVPAVGLAAGQPWRDMLLAGLTVAFATVPEELPILITLLLALGGRQLARQGALLRRLRAGETLGAVTTVVTDKTGTLTGNRLRLAGIAGDRREVLATALACQPPQPARREPMEAQLAEAAAADGLSRDGNEVAVFPFDPARKLASRARQAGDGIILAVSGAPEAVLERCHLDTATRAGISARLASLTGEGMRVIGFARRRLAEVPAGRDAAEAGLDYVGLAAFTDPLRDGVPAAVAALTRAGVATIVVTGDHPATAAAAAAQAGLPARQVLPGGDADAMPDAELEPQLRHGAVIARATPALKHRIVRLLQHRREIVAVTGDGANDAPALAAANVGIALGRHGAGLARAAAGLILTDDAYPTVVAAIAKGRNITAQLRRAVAFYLGAKLALVTILVTALASGQPIPFQPVHIVVLELFMDLGASVAFVAEPAAPAAMHRPPRPPGTGFLDRSVLTAVTTTAVTLTLAVLPGYLLLAHSGAGIGQARAAAVLAWLAAHALIAWTLRTQPRLPWRANPAFPAWALAALAAGTILTLTPASQLIGLQALPLRWLPAVAGLVVIATTAAYAARRTPLLARRL